MEARELRIGSWVINKFDLSGPKQMDLYYFPKVLDNPNMFEPIPLTKHWVEKMGFNDGKLEVTPFVNLQYYGDGKIVLVVEESYTVLTYIQNVHQVQNLYFSLTGQELQIKE